MDAGNAQLSSLQDEEPGFWFAEEERKRPAYAHNKKLLNELQVGDLVRFQRGEGLYMWFYDHWAVYIGDGEVVHVTGNEETACTSLGLSGSSKLKNAHIKRDDFWKVAEGSWALNGNTNDMKCTLSGEDIKRKALDCVGPVNYTLTERNCEHFAKLCRYGEASRNQADGLYIKLVCTNALTVFVSLVALALVEMISDEFKAYAVLVLSVLVAVIPLAKASDRIPMFCLFTVIVVSGVIGHVLAANIVTASIVVTSSFVPAVFKWNYFSDFNALLFWVDLDVIIACATAAMGAVDAASGVFGQSIFLTACTLSAAFALIIPNDFSNCLLVSAALFTYCVHHYLVVSLTCVIEVVAGPILIVIGLIGSYRTRTLARWVAESFCVFTASFLVHTMFSSINMADVIKLNMVLNYSYWVGITAGVLALKARLCLYVSHESALRLMRMYHETARFLFLSTLIMHWLHYDTQVSQVMDLSVLGDITDTAMNGTEQCYAP